MSYKADSDTDASSRNSKLYRGKAPIASMDAMEDVDLLSGSNTHLSKLSSECNIAGNAAASVNSAAVASMAVGGAAAAASLVQPPPPATSAKTTYPGLKYRNIGKTGLKVSSVALGSIKTFGANVDPEVAEDIVTTAYDNGVNYFDVCDPFNAERAERELGRIFAKKAWPRRTYFVSTRVFWHRSEMCSLSRKEILESAKQSLANLGLDYIDLLVVHKNDTNCPLEEVMRAMTYLVDSGQIMYWATARWSPFELFEAYSKAKEYRFVGPTCEIAEYHWFHREKVELYMAELYNKIGLGLMGWSPVSFGLAQGDKQEDSQGLVTKLLNKSLKHHTGCNQVPKNAMDSTAVNMEPGTTTLTQMPAVTQVTSLNGGGGSSDPNADKVKRLSAIADKLGCNLVQLQLAWQLRNQTVQSTTVSATSPDQLLDLLNSLSMIPKLTHGIIEDIDKILCNKPTRPPMISTLQARWATTGGVPPC